MNDLDRALHQRRRVLDEAFAHYDTAAATQRLASRIVQDGLAAALDPTTRPQPPTTPAPARDTDEPTTTHQARHRAATDLEERCLRVIARRDACALLTEFVRERRPLGAVVFACLLYLTGRSEPAAFWWRFAAGAEECEAMQLLVLHHRAIGETPQEDCWARSVPADCPSTGVPAPPDTARAERYLVRAEQGIEEVQDPDHGEVCLPRDWLPVRMTMAGRP